MSNKIYLKHQLLLALASVKEIDIKVLLFGEYEPIYAKHGDSDEKLSDALVCVTTGLKPEQLEDLSMPDYNSLENYVQEQVNRSSEFYFDQDGKEFNPAEPSLYDPLDCVEKIKYKVPTVKVCRLMESIEDTTKKPFEKAKYITMACTGLDADEISKLSVRDWNMLQGRINDFLQLDAGSLAKSQ